MRVVRCMQPNDPWQLQLPGCSPTAPPRESPQYLALAVFFGLEFDRRVRAMTEMHRDLDCFSHEAEARRRRGISAPS